MIWRIQRNILGVSIDLGIDDMDLIGRLRQKLYDIKLRGRWNHQTPLDRKQSKSFVSYALRSLPKDSFVSFDFDSSGANFVQFANFGGSIVLDVPLWSTNSFWDKRAEITKLLGSYGFKRVHGAPSLAHYKRKSFIYVQHCKEHKVIRAVFGSNCSNASEVGLLVAERVLGFGKPVVVGYDSHRLVPVGRSEFVAI